jgi:VWFA-related protein
MSQYSPRPRPLGFYRWSFSSLFFLLLTLSSPGQQPTYKIASIVVNVPATVHNKHGQIIRDLKKDDFVLQEDGHPREIRYFAQENDLPLTLGLLVDTSMSQRRVLEDEREASYAFLDRMLRQEDKAFIIHFDRESELLQDLTSDRQHLQSALQDLHTPDPESRRTGGGSWPGGGHRRGGWGGPGTVLYDAVFLASDELMKKQQGRKALLILSDGVDTGSMVRLERAIEAAQRADTIVYSILFYDAQIYRAMGPFGGWGRHGGTGGFSRYPDGRNVLEQISNETGGRLFEVSSKQPIASVYSQIADELRNQYNLGFAPGNDGLGYHKIQLKTRQKDLIVQARSGYYKDR